MDLSRKSSNNGELGTVVQFQRVLDPLLVVFEEVGGVVLTQLAAGSVDLFKNYQQWIKDTLALDDRAQLTVVAVLAA